MGALPAGHSLRSRGCRASAFHRAGLPGGELCPAERPGGRGRLLGAACRPGEQEVRLGAGISPACLRCLGKRKVELEPWRFASQARGEMPFGACSCCQVWVWSWGAGPGAWLAPPTPLLNPGRSWAASPVASPGPVLNWSRGGGLGHLHKSLPSMLSLPCSAWAPDTAGGLGAAPCAGAG